MTKQPIRNDRTEKGPLRLLVSDARFSVKAHVRNNTIQSIKQMGFHDYVPSKWKIIWMKAFMLNWCPYTISSSLQFIVFLTRKEWDKPVPNAEANFPLWCLETDVMMTMMEIKLFSADFSRRCRVWIFLYSIYRKVRSSVFFFFIWHSAINDSNP